MMKPWHHIVSLALLFSITIFSLVEEVHATLFRNSYISFELPPSWKCKLEKTTWICINKIENKKKKSALIVLTAKERGASDSYDIYTSYLKTPRALKGKPSKVLHVSDRLINHQRWIDALHQGSEAPSFWTRYVITLHGRLAVLVTFSAHRKFYTKYSADFIAAVQSLKLNKNASRLLDRKEVRGANEQLGAPVTGLIASHLGEGLPPEPQQGKSRLLTKKNLGLFFLILAGVILILIFFLKRKKH